MTKKCNKCGERKSVSEFAFRNRSAGIRRSDCRKCFSTLSKNHYRKNRTSYIDRDASRRLRNRNWILNYLSTKACADCGINDIRVLEFDHFEDNKSYEVALLIVKGYGLSTLEQEVTKCEVVCANCHKIRTDKFNNSYRHQFYLTQKEQNLEGSPNGMATPC